MFEDRAVVGFIEEVSILDKSNDAIKGYESVLARIDSGATVGSIDEKIVNDLNLEPFGNTLVKSSHGTTKRKIVKINICLAKKKVNGTFTVIDRSHMTYPILVGQDVLIQKFIIDCEKNLKDSKENKK